MITQKQVLYGFFAAIILMEVAVSLTSSKVFVWLQIALQCVFLALMIAFVVREKRKEESERNDTVLQVSVFCALWCLTDFLFTCQTYHIFTNL